MGLIRCENGHLFSEKKYGSVCPYCNTAVHKNSSKEEDPLGKYSDVVYLNDLEVLKPVTGWRKRTLSGVPAKWRYALSATKRSVSAIMPSLSTTRKKTERCCCRGIRRGLFIYWMKRITGTRSMSRGCWKPVTG